MMIDRSRLLDGLYLVTLEAAAKRLALTSAEAKCILDACNGLHLLPELLGQHLRAEVQDAIRLNHLDRKWDVDGRSLVARLRELPQSLTCAVEIWVAEWWASERLNEPEWEAEHLALVVRSIPRS